jgi:hypothetical protein
MESAADARLVAVRGFAVRFRSLLFAGSRLASFTDFTVTYKLTVATFLRSENLFELSGRGDAN